MVIAGVGSLGEIDGIRVGIDLGGTKIRAAVLEGEKLRGQASRLTPLGGGMSVVEAMVDTLDEALVTASVSLCQVQAVGVGAPGGVDANTGYVRQAANVVGFERGFDLGRVLQRKLERSLPVHVTNDGGAMAYAEHRMGAGRAFNDVLVISLGTGVGSGLILRGELHGARGQGGDIGHSVINPSGRKCVCGRRGCLEAYAGVRGMERAARRWVVRGERTELFEIMEECGLRRLTSCCVRKAASAGDAIAQRLLHDAGMALAITFTNCQRFLHLEAFVLGGGLAGQVVELLLKTIPSEIEGWTDAQIGPPRVLSAELGEFGGAIGAALWTAT